MNNNNSSNSEKELKIKRHDTKISYKKITGMSICNIMDLLKIENENIIFLDPKLEILEFNEK